MSESAAVGRAGAAAPVSEEGLVRGIGRWALVALMINGIVGSGIFGLPSTVHALAGPWALGAYLACALLMAVIALFFAELSSRFTRTGGPYLYAAEAFGPLAGFLTGWIMWLTRLSALAAIANVMTSYASFLWPPAAAGAGRALVMTGVVAILTAINLVGVRHAAGAGSLLTIAKLVPLVLFVAVGAAFVDGARFAAPPPTIEGVSKAVFALVFAFSGFEALTVAAGEARDPRRDMPFALLVSIGVASVLYLAIQTVAIGTLPDLATSQKPLADAGARFAGPVAGSIVAVGALISTVGTLLGVLIVGPRLLFAMADRGQIPRALAHVHPSWRTPDVAIFVTAGLGLALGLSGTFIHLLTLSVIARLLSYLVSAAAMLVLRRRGRAPEGALRVPAAAALFVIVLGASAWLLSKSGARELRDVAIAIAVGYVLHRLAHRGAARAPTHGGGDG